MKVSFWPLAVIALIALNPISCGSKSTSDDAPATAPGPKLQADDPKPSTDPTPTPAVDPTPAPVAKVVWADIQPAIAEKCIKCHAAAGKRPLDKPTLVWNGLTRDQVLVKFSASITNNTMPPKNQPQLTEEQKALLLKWVSDGALE